MNQTNETNGSMDFWMGGLLDWRRVFSSNKPPIHLSKNPVLLFSDD